MDIKKNNTELAKEIRQSFRLLMNGVTSQSMREKGVDYRINWGASLLHLKEMAAEYQQNKELAMTLWKDNVRECKIIATLLMPYNEFEEELAMQWIEQTHTQEIAEIASMNLYQHLPYACTMAMHLINDKDNMKQLHGYNILSRLFSKGEDVLKKEYVDSFFHHALTALQGNDPTLKHSAWNAVTHFADINPKCNNKARKALKSIKMDDWL